MRLQFLDIRAAVDERERVLQQQLHDMHSLKGTMLFLATCASCQEACDFLTDHECFEFTVSALQEQSAALGRALARMDDISESAHSVMKHR